MELRVTADKNHFQWVRINISFTKIRIIQWNDWAKITNLTINEANMAIKTHCES